MTVVTLVDTGPLVAMCNKRDRYHAWTLTALRNVAGALTTCEPVLTEACFLLKQAFGGADELFELMERGLLRIEFSVAVEHKRVQHLMSRHADLPTSLADACLVRLAELHPSSRVMTLDRDFTVYRRHGRQAIPLLAPFT